jgi:zinc/manganese transport system substrate-binding protein
MLTLLFLMASVTASAELEIFACEPEWAALADEIGGDLVTSYSATTALQDPHYIQARPSLIAKVRKADLVICSGATANLDRARGDIHPQGNPHIQTDPHNISAVARALSERLVKIDSVNSEAYETNLEQFLIRWEQAVSRWEDRAEPLRGKRAITHHKSWVYLLRWLGIEEVEHLEAIPGLPPTATHLGKLTAEFGSGGADVIIRSPYQHAKPSEWLAERTGIPAIILPLTVGGTEGATDLFALFDDIVGRLIEVVGDA